MDTHHKVVIRGPAEWSDDSDCRDGHCVPLDARFSHLEAAAAGWKSQLVSSVSSLKSRAINSASKCQYSKAGCPFYGKWMPEGEEAVMSWKQLAAQVICMNVAWLHWRRKNQTETASSRLALGEGSTPLTWRAAGHIWQANVWEKKIKKNHLPNFTHPHP